MFNWKWLLLIIPFIFWFGFFLGVVMSNISHNDELIKKLIKEKKS